MSTIFSLFMVLIIIACVLLVIIVMAQNLKGGGLSLRLAVLLHNSAYRERMILWKKQLGY